MHDGASLTLVGVEKRLGGTQALSGVNLSIAGGEVVGLLGPNGAGKTTLVRLVLDLLRPDAGTVRVLGHAPADRPRASVGYLPEERGLYPKVKVLPLLRYLVSLSGLSPREAGRLSAAWLERVGLGDRLRARADTLSKGMQQKVQLGAAILHEPQVVILDEPFTGLDPLGRRLVGEVVAQMRDRGAAVLISSHLLDQVQQLCDRVVLVREGKVLLEGKVPALRAHFGRGRYRLGASPGFEAALEGLATVESIPDDTAVFLKLTQELEPAVAQRRILERLLAAQVAVHHFSRLEPSLEEIFIEAVLQAESDAIDALRASELRAQVSAELAAGAAAEPSPPAQSTRPSSGEPGS